MEKFEKTYVEYLIWGRDWNQKEVSSRNIDEVSKVINLDDINELYFFDIGYIKDGEEIYTGSRKNVSPKIYIGERISMEEALNLAKESGSQSAIEYVEKLIKFCPQVINMCKTNWGVKEMYEDEVTLDEYLSSKNKKK